MPLSTEERGLLDKQIDEATKTAPAAVKGFRVLKHKYHFKEENDAVYGFILGAIIGSFNQWMSDRSKEVTDEIDAEIKEILYNRSAEIRDAIFKAG
jgi:hypothetical protein